MASINVNSGVTDQFYRYKMPRIIAKVEGKGNGIKTVIVNMPDIAKALARPPTYPTKFFGCELGAQTQFDLKNDRYIVNGSHDASKLQGLLDGFIRKFVLCPECQNPETNLVVKSKAQTISQRCIACGHTGNVDMRHKLTTFILKNPPDQEANQTPSKSKKSKKEKKEEKKDERGSPEVNAQEQMAQQRAAGGVIDAPPETSTYNDDDWGEDVSEEAIKERMKELSDAAKSLALSDDVEKTIEDRLNIFWQFVKDKVNTGSVSSPNVQKDIVTEAERLEVKDKSTLVLVELLFDEKILQQIKKYRKLFLRVCHENQKAQRYLLGGLEQLVGKVHKETLMPKVPHIFKSLYDLDIVDEEVLLEWGEKVSKKYVSKEIAKEIHEKAQPVLEWLKEAEEESEDDSEDEEGKVQVDFSSTEKVGEQKIPVTPVTPNNNNKQIENHKDMAKEDEDEDDIDIDNI